MLGSFEEFKLVTQEASIDNKSTTLEVLKEKFPWMLDRLSVDTTVAVGLLMRLDGTDPADMTPIVKLVITLPENMTKAEQERIYWELWFTYREKNPQRHCEGSNIELSQGTKASKQTPGNCTASPIVENNETKTLKDTCDNPVITSEILNQNSDVAHRTVSPIVENSETKILNNTFDKNSYYM